jgi:hypothetical protein
MHKFILMIHKKNSVRTSQEIHYVSATKMNVLTPFREISAVYCENHMKYNINTLCGQNSDLVCINLLIYMEPLGSTVFFARTTFDNECAKMGPSRIAWNQVNHRRT